MRVQLVIRWEWVQPPPGSATSFHGDWSWSIFYGHSLLPLIQERQLLVSGERMCTILVNHLEDQVKVWLGSTWPHWVDWIIKPQHKQDWSDLMCRLIWVFIWVHMSEGMFSHVGAQLVYGCCLYWGKSNWNKWLCYSLFKVTVYFRYEFLKPVFHLWIWKLHFWLGSTLKNENRMANCWSRWDGSSWAISSGSTLFANVSVLVYKAEKVNLEQVI